MGSGCCPEKNSQQAKNGRIHNLALYRISAVFAACFIAELTLTGGKNLDVNYEGCIAKVL